MVPNAGPRKTTKEEHLLNETEMRMLQEDLGCGRLIWDYSKTEKLRSHQSLQTCLKSGIIQKRWQQLLSRVASWVTLVVTCFRWFRSFPRDDKSRRRGVGGDMWHCVTVCCRHRDGVVRRCRLRVVLCHHWCRCIKARDGIIASIIATRGTVVGV